MAVNGTNIFAGLHGWNGRIPVPLGVKVSTDNGSTWVYHGLDTFFVNAFAASGTRAFAGSGHSGIFLSTDNGANWTMTGLNNYSVSAFAVTGTNIFVTADDTAGDGVFLSTNNGKSWTEVSTGLPMIAYVHKLAVSGAHLFAGTYGGSVWRRPLEEMVVPVELKTFIAVANGKEVTLNWSTATELNNQGFEVLRKFGSNDFVTIGSVKGHGTTTSPNNYTYVDKLTDAGKYFYRLKQIDYGGKYEYSQTVEINWSPFTAYKLEQNFSNPFNPTTTIGFGIPEKGNVRLSVLNILGEEIKILLNEERETGYHSIDFNGSDLPSGVYFYQLRAGEFIQTRKMILLR